MGAFRSQADDPRHPLQCAANDHFAGGLERTFFDHRNEQIATLDGEESIGPRSLLLNSLHGSPDKQRRSDCCRKQQKLSDRGLSSLFHAVLRLSPRWSKPGQAPLIEGLPNHGSHVSAPGRRRLRAVPSFWPPVLAG